MGDADREPRARRAGRSIGSASRTAGRFGKGAANGAGRVVHRLSSASGAGRTGLSSLIELTAASSWGTRSWPCRWRARCSSARRSDEARGRVALALLITIAPFAILAPFLGPMLDRVQQGRRYILMGTLLARGLLCWGMAGAVQHNDTLTLLPAAFGVLVLQKAYGVTRAAVTPRLLPSEITLVSANARSALGSGWSPPRWAPGLRRASPTCSAAARAERPGCCASARRSTWPRWCSRCGCPMAWTAPEPAPEAAADGPADSPLKPGDTWPETPVPGEYAGQEQYAGDDGPQRSEDRPGPGGARPAPAGRGSGRTGLRRLFTMPTIGPIVREAMEGNATLRAFSGFMIFFLAFILRTEHFAGTSGQARAGRDDRRGGARRLHRHRHRRRPALPRAPGHRVRHAHPGHRELCVLRHATTACGRR